ncbi:unnamed protein product, partial [Porites evermanni]
VLTGIATQGHPEQPYRTLTYKLRHTISLDEAFTTYPKNVLITLDRLSVLHPVQVLVYQDMATYIRGLDLVHGVLRNRMLTNISSSAYIISTFVSSPANLLVITGNVDRNSTVFHFFSTSLVTRYLRFHTQSWHNRICMRVGIYGCAVNDRRAVSAGRPSDVSDCAVCNVNARCISSQGNTGRCVCKHGFVGDGKNCEGNRDKLWAFGPLAHVHLSFKSSSVRYNYNAASLATVGRKRFCLTDRDECSSSISPCPEQADCENALGSFRCLCRPGYKGTDSQNSSCADIDECKISGSCFRVGCINFPGSFKCDCGITGLFYDPQDRNCKDIDECSDGSFECNPLAFCINTYGSYACICPDGYKGGGRRVCADVNECRRRPNPCGNTTVCQNTKGSYQCGCRAGFIWQNNTCVDIDECSIGAFKCRVHTECVNTIGSYTCKCKQGFYSNGPHCLGKN